MSLKSQLSFGPAVVVPLVILLLASVFGNLYQSGLLSISQDRVDAWDFSISAHKLSLPFSGIEETQAGIDAEPNAEAGLVDAAKPTLTSLLERASLGTLPGTISNASRPSDFAGVLTSTAVWPELSAAPEQHTHRRLDTNEGGHESSGHESSGHESSGHESSGHESSGHESSGGGAKHESSGSKASSGSSASSSGADTCKEFEGEHTHQHVALLFLFNILLLGTALLHVNAFYPKLQFTIMLFIFGMIISAILEGASLKCKTGILGQSYIMWMDIDPHLLLFTMLPALLAGDAMTIDTSVAKRVSLQCLYLAGPGVLVSAFGVAAFLYVYFDWSFMICLATASILCATDPVAVVALLKELGASPVLTVQIQGESLLNDGTAIVLYTVAYEIISGEEYDSAKIVMFLVKVALLACAVGCLTGYVFFSWLRIANDRFKHSCEVIQVLLTLCAAYWSFIMAEGVLHMSGVLATVCSSLVLAHHMWPHIANKETLSNFWHLLEEIMNIIIFLLAGSLCGQVMVHIDLIDYLHLLVIYVVLTVFRGCLIFGSRPLLRILNYDNMAVSKSDAAVMTWGGLRGAVGLALAIQVQRGRGENADGIPQIDEDTSQRILFFVSGIAFLTTTINATTCPFLVNVLGITALPHAQELLLRKFTHQLVAHSEASEHPEQVSSTLHEMLHHVEEEIHEKSEHDIHVHDKVKEKMSGNKGGVRKSIAASMGMASMSVESDVICKAYEAVRQVYQKLPEKDKSRLDHPAWGPEDLVADTVPMMRIIRFQEHDHDICKVVNRTFMSMVANNYHRQIEAGDLRPGSPEHDFLLTSIRFSQSSPTTDLVDYHFIHHYMEDSDVIEGNVAGLAEEAHLNEELRKLYVDQGKSAFLPTVVKAKTFMKDNNDMVVPTASMVMNRHFKHHSTDAAKDEVLSKAGKCKACIDKFVRSKTFSNVAIAAILLNGVCVVIDELARNDENRDHLAWLIVELFFSLIFTLEAAFKIAHSPRAYFKDVWNKFDFFLVIVGIVGGALSTIEYVNAVNDHNESSALTSASRASRIIRIAKILRSMRLLKLFVLFHAMLSSDRRVSYKLAATMVKIQALSSFVRGHIHAQRQMKKFFVGSFEDESEVEIARCVMQSLIFVHKALHAIIRIQRCIDTEVLDELLAHKETKRITEELELFVQEAEENGAVSAQEAHAILHPMHHTLAHCIKSITTIDEGVVIRHDAKGHGESSRGSKKGLRQSIENIAENFQHGLSSSEQDTMGRSLFVEAEMDRQLSSSSEERPGASEPAITDVNPKSASRENAEKQLPLVPIQDSDLHIANEEMLLVEEPAEGQTPSRPDQVDSKGVGQTCNFCSIENRQPGSICMNNL